MGTRCDQQALCASEEALLPDGTHKCHFFLVLYLYIYI